MPAFLLAIPGALKLVPKWAWYAIAGALLLAGAVIWHHGKVKSHDTAVIAARDAYWNERIAAVAKQAAALRVKAEAAQSAISTDVRNRNVQANRDIAAAADALRLSGPGASRCRPVDHSSLPAGASGPVAPGGASSGAGPQVPADDFAAVPWGWLTDSAEQADLNRAEVLSWREWYQRASAAWEKTRAAKP